MKKILAVAVVMLMAASAQAAYMDAISVNIAGTNSTGTVSGTQVGGAGAASHWINLIGSHSANLAASADGSGWTSGSFDYNLSETGAALGSFRVDMYDGGWGQNSTWSGGASGANTLGASGISNGEMINNWGPTNMGLTISNIPASFQAAGYDVWALVGSTRNSGDGLAWVKCNTTPLTSATTPTYGLNNGASALNGYRSIAAFQVAAVPEPATMSLLVIGGVATLIRRRNRR